jgi:VWFA-related protein
MKSRWWSLVIAGLTCVMGLAPMCAQDGKPTLSTAPAETAAAAKPASTLQVQARLVVLPTVVRDKKGALVNDLKQGDFSLQVDGKPQTIRYFDHDTDVPLTLGLLVDVSESVRKELDEERSASQSFLDTMLTPGSGSRAADKGFVVQFAKDIELLQDVTDDHGRLQKALHELGTESPSFHNADDTSTANTDSQGRYIRHGGTALYDAIYLSGDDVTAKQAGRRRALVVLTDGVDRGSKESLTDAIEAAQRADTTVYGIYYKGEQPRQDNWNRNGGRHRGYGGGWPGGGGGYPGGGYPGGGGGYPGGGGNNPQGGNNPRGGGDHIPYVDGRHVLERICGETGGRVFEVSKKQTIEDIYKQIGEELRSQYRLGFTPTSDAATDKYHQINLQMTGDADKKKLDVQTRDGYYMSAD